MSLFVKELIIKKFVVLALLLMPTVCWADWEMDFYRYQCVPEIGRIFIDTFDVQNPSDYGKIKYLGSNKALFEKLSKEHEIYAVEGNAKEFKCTLGEHVLLISFKFSRNSQGQSSGRISIKSDGGKLIEDLKLFAYYGYDPLVKSLEISLDPSSSKLFASFEVIGAMTGAIKHSNFNFSRELNGSSPITDFTIREEATKHP